MLPTPFRTLGVTKSSQVADSPETASPVTALEMVPKVRADSLEMVSLETDRATDLQCRVLSMTTMVGERE